MKLIKTLLLSLGLTVFVGGITLAVAALIISKTAALPDSMLPIITTGLCTLSVFLGSLLAALAFRERGILVGLITGSIILIISILLSLLIFQTPFTPAGTGKMAAILIGAAIGGILGVNRKNKVKF